MKLPRALVRLINSIVTLWLALTAVFFLSRSTGDPAVQAAGEFATKDEIAQVHAELGLNKPLWDQYLTYFSNFLHGDLGQSLQYHVSNFDLIKGRFAATASLALLAVVVAAVIGVPMGVLSARRENSVLDRVVTSLTLVGQSAPLFWIGLMSIVLFGVKLGWLPAGGRAGPDSYVLPVLTLALLPLAQTARLTRAGVSETLREVYFVAGLARGLSPRRMIWRHCLRNAALPVITVMGLQVGLLLSGAVTTEFVFAWPGLGTLATNGVKSDDFPLVQAIVVVGAVTIIVANLVVDMLYPVLDPRLRRQRSL